MSVLFRAGEIKTFKAEPIEDDQGTLIGGQFVELDYENFLRSKRVLHTGSGVTVSPDKLNKAMFPFQRAITSWALRKGRAAIFAGTGMGKTIMQLEWAKVLGCRTLILAPLAVANQTVAEGKKFGIDVTYARDESEASESGITITNYERLEKFDASAYGAVVLDESSILKSFTGKTRTALIKAFERVPDRLCCTATPAPNDIAEIANHCEFLGIMTRVEMLASFFVHDDEGWRLKRHAIEPFYRWLASWAMTISKPSDLGYEDDGFKLPKLEIVPHFTGGGSIRIDDMLIPIVKGIKGRLQARRGSQEERIGLATELLAEHPDQPWIIWCGLNDESAELGERIPGAVTVEGSDSIEAKIDALTGFVQGRYRVLITKPRIAGFGMNFQHCSRMIFVGLGDSWEQYYQAIRRCLRFGQKSPVFCHIVLSEPERVVYDNIMRKEAQAAEMMAGLIAQVKTYEEDELKGSTETVRQGIKTEKGDGWEMIHGDCVEAMRKMDDASVDLSVFSPPFSTLFTYSNSELDLGNSKDYSQFFEHFGFISLELLRIMKPGRNVCVHVQQLSTTQQTDGVIGMRDFRGDVIRHFIESGFIYHGEVCIDKDPQAQAIRTHSKGLLFVQLRKDSSWLRSAFGDYILVFRTPGENAEPIHPDITNEQWIEWARPVWYGIKESDTLNVAEARAEKDERHICPLQLGTIERCVELWSNKGDLVFSPFAGIGSEGYQSLLCGRRFIGVELKREYFQCAVRNLRAAENKSKLGTLFANVT